MGIVFNIQKFCLHDGDGIRTCVFLKGCPLRCIWCHNPESLERTPSLAHTKSKCTSCGRCLATCPGRSIVDGKLTIDRDKCTLCGECVNACLMNANEVLGREMSAEEVFAEVLKDKIFYESSGGGITVSGGEPSYQPEFTLKLLEMAKEAGISRAIETCGIGSRDFYTAACDMGTTFLFDIKCIDAARHRELTGADNAHILSNLTYLFDRGADVIIRLPMIPGCNDSEADIKNLCMFLNTHKGKYRYAEIMPYHTLGIGKSERLGVDAKFVHDSASNEDIDRWTSLFASFGTDVRVSK